MSISTADIKLLRELTGAGVLDCKKALQETNGDIDKASELLRKKGLAAAAKKANREANDGLISAQMSDDGQTAVMVEVNCETDFVARTEDFQKFVDAMVQQVLEQPGLDRVEALLAAPYLDDPGKTVQEQLTEIIARLGENMIVRRVARFDLPGEGMLESYVHPGARVGVLVEVAGGDPRDSQFAELVHDLALQIAAAAPHYVSEADIPAEAIAAEKEFFQTQLVEDKKPDNIKERIVEGKLKKWYSEVVLLNQEFIKDPDLTIAKLLQKSGNNITVRRFARFERGV
ncbi:MAG: elongation factor Ts [Anaerolineae bacterium]|nr:elongation factor Ts [Anaerolineae bacterium]